MVVIARIVCIMKQETRIAMVGDIAITTVVITTHQKGRAAVGTKENKIINYFLYEVNYYGRKKYT